MSKRRGDSLREPVAKRSKRERIASPPSETITSVAGGAYSVRKVGSNACPALTTAAIKRFVTNLLDQTSELKKANTIATLQNLPDHLLQRVWLQLIEAWPERMAHHFIIAIFLRGSKVIFPGTLPGVTKDTIREIRRMSDTLSHLEITGHGIPDKVFATTISALPQLDHVDLRDCKLVGTLTCQALTHESLKYLNLSNTAATISDIKPVLLRSLNLEALKISSLEGLTDTTLTRLLDDFYEDISDPVLVSAPQPLGKLRSLTLRHTLVTGVTLSKLIPHLPSLKKLDMSFVPIGIMPLDSITSIPSLTKLSLMSTPIEAQRLLPVLEHLPELKTLNIAALGASAKTARGFDIGGASTGAMGSRTLTDGALLRMTEILRTCSKLESVSLAGNASLGQGKERAVSYFIQQVGRKLKYLNLGGLQYVRSSDLEGLLAEDVNDECTLERLILRGCNVGDQAAPFMACPYLTFLDVQNTKFSEEGLLDIIDACPRLETLDLTSCRGVKLRDRRQFFDVWREQRVKKTKGN